MFSIANDKLMRYLNTANVKGVIIPDTIKELTGYSFHNKDSKGVRFVWIPDHITEIPDHCFEGSDVEFVRISPQTKRIGDCAFRNCKNLVSVKVPKDCGLGTKRSTGGWANSETVFENCPKLRKTFVPWVDSMTAEYADKRYATAIIFEGGFLVKSADKWKWSDDFVSDKGWHLPEPDKHFYYRVMDLNPKPSARFPGKYVVRSRIIYV
jgi:hypothetical protein